jgi:hypothetical protein
MTFVATPSHGAPVVLLCVNDMLTVCSGAFDSRMPSMLEHIEPAWSTVPAKPFPLGPHGVASRSVAESQGFATPKSKAGERKSAPTKKVLSEFFHNVFMFSMNDEVVHTGFHKMAYYVFAVGAGKQLTRKDAPGALCHGAFLQTD